MTVKDEITDHEKRLVAAMTAGDVHALSLLMHDGLVFTSHLGHVMNKESDLEAHRSGILQLSSIIVLDLLISEFGDTVIVSALKNIAGNYGGEVFQSQVRFLRVWKKAEARWQIIAGSSVAITQ